MPDRFTVEQVREAEKAAVAAFCADTGWPEFMWPQIKPESKDRYRSMALAALTASDDDA